VLEVKQTTNEDEYRLLVSTTQWKVVFPRLNEYSATEINDFSSRSRENHDERVSVSEESTSKQRETTYHFIIILYLARCAYIMTSEWAIEVLKEEEYL